MGNPLQKLLSRYFTLRSLPYWTVLIADCCIVLFSFLMAHWIVCGLRETGVNFHAILIMDFLFMLCFMVGFKLRHTYLGIVRFSSFNDLSRMASACLIGLVLSLIVEWAFSEFHWIYVQPISVLVVGTMLTVLLMWGLRIWAKRLYDTSIHQSRTTPIFIYGTKQGGMAIAKSINSSHDSPYIIRGFITDGKDMVDKRIGGVLIYRNDEHLVEKMKAQGVKTLLVSPLKTSLIQEKEDMVNALMNAGIKIMLHPADREWDGKSEFSYTQLREVSVEDLLPRDKIEVDLNQISQLLNGRRILITGAAGSIGSEIVRQIAQFNPGQLILIDQAETPLHDIRLMMARQWPDIDSHTIVSDIANQRRMEEIFRLFRPEYVFHAAAYKHVPMMEDNPFESIQNNVNGTRVIADLAVKYGTSKFVMVSTDKAVNPTNVMGCSKRICEIYVQSLDKAIKDGKIQGSTAFVTTRFGNVLGSNGSVIPLFESQIKAGGPVTVTHPDIIRFFMLIPEACRLVLEAGTMGQGGEVFVFDMGKPVKIADLAKRMILMSGAHDIEIVYTGLRDGEKLYEEVLNDKEITLPTFHPKIKIAKVREYDFFKVSEIIGQLIADSFNMDDMAIVAEMKAIVPEFKSQHSKYEALDHQPSQATR